MTSEDDAVLVVLNGEIVNHAALRRELVHRHSFKSKSDAEVVIHLYEDDPLGFACRLDGLFAFALWDARRQTLVLGRDRFGVKPLFCVSLPDRVLFASEIKGVLAHPKCPRGLDWERALADPQLSGAFATYDCPPTSFFVGVDHVAPATVEHVQYPSGRRATLEYWKLPDRADVSCGADEFVTRYRDLLVASVENCLQGEAEIGVMLSGGVDSAIVAAVGAARQSVRTFGVLSESTYVNGDAAGAAEVALGLGVTHEQVVVSAVGQRWTPDDWIGLLWHCETPFCGPEQLFKYQLHGWARRGHPNLKVMLSGQGSDEFNGGYSSLFSADADSAWSHFMMRQVAMASERAAPHALDGWRTMLPLNAIRSDVLQPARAALEDEAWRRYLIMKRRDLVMFNLWHEDRTAAAHGIESRVPFLDHRLVELVVSVPDTLRRQLFANKAILREATRAWLPARIRNRPKIPFCYGRGAVWAAALVLDLAASDDFGLVERAFAQGSGQTYVDIDSYVTGLRNLLSAPERTGWVGMLRLLNLGLLAHVAESAAAPVVSASPAIAVSIEHPESLNRAAACYLHPMALGDPLSTPTVTFSSGDVMARPQPRSSRTRSDGRAGPRPRPEA